MRHHFLIIRCLFLPDQARLPNQVKWDKIRSASQHVTLISKLPEIRNAQVHTPHKLQVREPIGTSMGSDLHTRCGKIKPKSLIFDAELGEMHTIL